MLLLLSVVLWALLSELKRMNEYGVTRGWAGSPSLIGGGTAATVPLLNQSLSWHWQN